MKPDDQEARSSYRCQKYNCDRNGGAPRCPDPELYCKFRSACVIHFIQKEAARAARRDAGEADAESSKPSQT